MNDGSVNVFVPEGDEAERLQAIVAEWTVAKLLQSSLWVPPIAKDDLATGGPSAVLVGPSGTTQVSVLDALATRPFRTVRLVTIRMPKAGSGGVPPAVIDALAEHIRRALAHHQRFEQLNVVVPASDEGELPADAFRSIGVNHILVAPEDRRSDAHVSRGVIPGDNLAAHAAAAVATVAGAWRIMEAAPFDGQHFGASNEQPQVRAVRVFARLVSAGELTASITQEVFARRRAATWAAHAVNAVPAHDPDHIVGSLVEQVFEHEPALRCTPFVARSQPTARTMRRRDAFLMMFRFIGEQTRTLPGRLRGRITSTARRTADELTQRVTFGEESWVRVSGRSARDLADADERAEPGLDVATRLLSQAGHNVTPPAAARAWRTLRAMTFGAVDAGLFPEGLAPPSDGSRRLVITDLDAVVPPPESDAFRLEIEHTSEHTTLPAWASAPISADDPSAALRLGRLLQQRCTQALGGVPESVSDDGTTAPAIPPDEDAADALAVAADDLDEFRQRHARSLWWRIGERLAGEQRRASARLTAALGAVTHAGTDAEQMQAQEARRRLGRRWTTGVAVALMLALSSSWLRRYEWAFTRWGAIALISLTVLVAWWFFSFLPYQRQLFQINHRLDRRQHDYKNAMAAAEHYAAEVVRLTSVYAQFTEWAQIMSWLIHRPEGEGGSPPATADEVPLTRPLSVGLGVGEPDTRALQRAAALVGRQVFGRGWLTNLYMRFLRTAMRELKHQQGLGDSARDPDPDSEIATPAPRTFLRDFLADSGHADEWRQEVFQRVTDALRDLPPGELFSRVRPSHVEGDVGWDARETASPNEFVSQILPASDESWEQALSSWVWSTIARLNAAESVDRAFVWSTVAVAGGDLAPNITVHPTVQDLDDERFWAQCVRLDVARACAVSDLAIVRRTSESVDEAVERSEREVW